MRSLLIASDSVVRAGFTRAFSRDVRRQRIGQQDGIVQFGRHLHGGGMTQRQRVLAMKRDLKFYTLNLGLTYDDIAALFRGFESAGGGELKA